MSSEYETKKLPETKGDVKRNKQKQKSISKLLKCTKLELNAVESLH